MSGVKGTGTPAIARIWPRVERRGPDQCWPWTGPLGKKNRPSVTGGPGEKKAYAARFVLEEKLGRPLRPGHEACHSCDWPPCCNPSHLWEGTHAENVADRDAKGRQVRGGRHWFAKYTDEQVREIRDYPAGVCATARAFGVTHAYVGRLRGRTARPTIRGDV